MYKRSRPTGTIKRRLRKVERAVRESTQIVALKQTYGATSLASYVNVFPLTNYTQMTPTFGITAADLAEKPKAFHRKVGIDCVLDMANEKDTITYTIFIVSLKSKMMPFVNQVSGTLTLTLDTHFSFLNGMAMVNKDYFNIHKIKRIATGNHGKYIGDGAPNYGYFPLNSDDTRIRHRWYMRHTIKAQVSNSIGDWTTLSYNPVIARNHYVLVFNDNSALDAENPVLSMNMVHTLKTAV